ncbi:MAG: hypothetical protein LBH19_06260, partial [Dysgonamonadaceae bacterium]|nr:hypothetical protein [Dysgonamonadaceae bacterium]
MLVNQLKYGLIFLVACLFSDLHANEIIIRQIPVAEQLPSNTVYRMFQDRNGFVWFGTPNGFCRYDGYEMKNFRSEVAGTLFPSNYITGGFAEDTLNHTLWIGTEKGVLILDEQSHKITLLDTALLGESPIRQIEYAGNAMWICSDFGLYLYGSDKTLKKKYLPEAGSIHIDRQGTVRVTVWNGGLYYLDKATDTFVPYPRIGPNNNPHKIFQDAAGQCWICTWGEGLYRFYPDRKGQSMYERITLHDEKFNSGIFFGMEQDNVNGYFWVLSYSGITVFRLDDDRIAPVNEFISSINDITNIYSDIIKDKNGNLWLGTYEQGAIVVSPNRSSVTNFKLQSIKTETGYIPNVTTAICEDEEGELWFKQSRLG